MSLYDYFTGELSWSDYIKNRDLGQRFEKSLVKTGAGMQLQIHAAAASVDRAISQGFGALVGDIEADVDRLSYDIQDISHGIAELRADFHVLMGDVIWKLELQNDTMATILRALQAPLDTAAKELRRRAEDAYANAWYDEALQDFLVSEEKNYQDFAVHRSIGNIYLFHRPDLPKAFTYFAKSAKYAAPRNANLCAEAHHFAAICAGLLQDFPTAYQEACEAATLNPEFYEAHYARAGFAAFLGKTAEVKHALRSAIDGDPRYHERATTDKMFDAVRPLVDAELRDILNHTQKKLYDQIQATHAALRTIQAYIQSWNETTPDIDVASYEQKATAEILAIPVKACSDVIRDKQRLFSWANEYAQRRTASLKSSLSNAGKHEEQTLNSRYRKPFEDAEKKARESNEDFWYWTLGLIVLFVPFFIWALVFRAYLVAMVGIAVTSGFAFLLARRRNNGRHGLRAAKAALETAEYQTRSKTEAERRQIEREINQMQQLMTMYSTESPTPNR